MQGNLAAMVWRSPEGKTPSDRDSNASADLLMQARQGDPAAFETLLEQHKQRVFGVAWRLLGQAEDARDVCQEVFLRLYRSLHRIDPERPLAAWIYRVTVNVCRDHGRRRASRNLVPLEGSQAEHSPSSPADDPARRAVAREEQRIVAAGLAQLGSKERAALVLRDVEGLSTDEVAEILGSSPQTVRSQICHARLKLAKHRRSCFEHRPKEENHRELP